MQDFATSFKRFYNMGNGYYNPNMQGPNYANNMQNGYNQQVNPNKKNLFAILSLIFGGISVVAGIIYRIFLYNTTTYSYRYLYGNAVWSIIMMYVAIPLAIAGLTLGILGIVKAKKYVNEQS